MFFISVIGNYCFISIIFFFTTNCQNPKVDPKSFTGEDTYEMYIHGSIVIERLIYKALSSY